MLGYYSGIFIVVQNLGASGRGYYWNSDSQQPLLQQLERRVSSTTRHITSSGNAVRTNNESYDTHQDQQAINQSQQLFPCLLVCRMCPYSTTVITDYHAHLVSTHDHDPKLLSCPYCAYVAVKLDNFRVHLRKHTGEKPYSCSYCSYRCAHRSNLKVHMKRCFEKNGAFFGPFT